jgi:RNA recognition motif-containing protein
MEWDKRMRVTLYVGGLEEQVDDGQLRSLFGEFGSVADTRVVFGDDGRCRGFAYVTFDDDLAAAKARVALDGKEVDGRTLRVALAT